MSHVPVTLSMPKAIKDAPGLLPKTSTKLTDEREQDVHLPLSAPPNPGESEDQEERSPSPGACSHRIKAGPGSSFFSHN